MGRTIKNISEFSIEDCKSYLSLYPNGKDVDKVKQKLDIYYENERIENERIENERIRLKNERKKEQNKILIITAMIICGIGGLCYWFFHSDNPTIIGIYTNLDDVRELQHLALRYFIDDDFEHAAYWYTEAADRFDDAFSEKNLGWIYCSRFNDCDSAIYWYEKALKHCSDEDKSDIQKTLGDIYMEKKQDTASAFYWYEKSAKQGNEHSQYILGGFYENGFWVTKNKKEAIYWYEKSAKQGNSKAKYKLKKLEHYKIYGY